MSFLAARDLGQVERGFRRGIQTADMRHHDSRIDAAGGGQLERLDHIRRIAAGRAHNVRGVVVYIVKIHLGRKLLVGRAGEEVQAAIAAEHRAAKLDDRRDQRIAEHVVKARAAGQRTQLCGGIGHLAGVDKVQLDAVLFLDLCGREQRLGAGWSVNFMPGLNCS